MPTLVGNLAHRANLIAADPDLQGDETNTYEGFIPFNDVKERVFNWQPVEVPHTVRMEEITSDGVDAYTIEDDRKNIVRPRGSLGPMDRGGVLGVHGGGYKPHGYAETLLEPLQTVCDRTDGQVGITMAASLSGGRRAFVELSGLDTITGPEGLSYSPNLVAMTSLDGSLSTIYAEWTTLWACHNIMSCVLGGKSDRVKVRHTKHSAEKLSTAIDALAVVQTIGEKFNAQLEMLLNTPLTPQKREDALELFFPIEDKEEGRGLTRNTNTREEFNRMFSADPRVAPWADTAFGFIQARNTYAHWTGSVHAPGEDDDGKARVRIERNRNHAIDGKFDSVDVQSRKALEKIGVLTAV